MPIESKYGDMLTLDQQVLAYHEQIANLEKNIGDIQTEIAANKRVGYLREQNYAKAEERGASEAELEVLAASVIEVDETIATQEKSIADLQKAIAELRITASDLVEAANKKEAADQARAARAAEKAAKAVDKPTPTKRTNARGRRGAAK